MTERLILASQSPRRKEILSVFSLPFIQRPSSFDEESVSFQGDPKAYAIELSQNKAREIAKEFPHDIIISADTIVFLNGKVYNKPKNEEEAFSMLKDLSGQWHQVYTAVTVQQGKATFSDIEATRILFQTLTDEQIKAYHRSCSFLDKAGGYGIQNSGSIIVERIDGCYYNVMGLPIHTLKTLLLNVGINLWEHLKSF